MIGVEISVEGLDRLLSAVDRRDGDAAAAMERSILRLALLIERLAKDKYVPVVTGRLKSSIGGQLAPRPMRPGDAVFERRERGREFEVLVGSNVIYASIIEFGTRRSGGRRRGTRAVRELAADAARTGSRSNRRRTGNGRHGPFLRPALNEAIPAALPVLRREFESLR
ncbi:MAG: hypothetical protein C0498_01335 [Anaerolinea sp.]|nr:hypothetical protein [Anaerolinea sp.]